MKKNCVIYAPVDSYSGYGAAARDKVQAIIESISNEFDIKIISCRWGSLPMGFIDDHIEDYGDLKTRFISNNLQYQPDLMIWITVPSEVQKVGKYNILFTAGIETTITPGDWIEGINRMDLVIMPSNHSKNVAINSVFNKVNPQTQQQEEIKVTTPIEVIFEGFKENIYKKLNSTTEFKNKELFNTINSVKETFGFLFTGLWIGNSHIQDRKNISELLYTFYQTFKDVKNKPCLFLKTSTASCNYIDIDRLKEKIDKIKESLNIPLNKLPNVYLIHGEFTDEEMNEIYNHPKIKCMISLTRGEGFGRPLLEFSSIGKPVIASGWSGHVDFLNKEESILIGGKLEQVHPLASNNMILKESMWFSPDLNQASYAMKQIMKIYKDFTNKSKKLGYLNRSEFNYNKMQEKIKNTFDKYVKLPSFQPINLPKLNTLKLPTLEK